MGVMGCINRPQRLAGSRRMPDVKNIGKPCAGEPHARFDEGGQVNPVMLRLLRHHQTKGVETDRPRLKQGKPVLYSTQLVPDPN